MIFKKLSEVTQIIAGGTPKSSVKEYWNGSVFWITPADMGKLKTSYVNNTSRKITELGLQKSSAKIFPENSVILSTRAPIGHIAINKVAMSTNQGCKSLVPNQNLDTKYLFYYLKNIKKNLQDLGTGTTFKELSSSKLKEVEIPILPLSEQKKIVETLDKAFEKIDKAIANVERNIENAEELFQSKLEQIFSETDCGFDKSWDHINIDKVCDIKPPKAEAKQFLSYDDEVSFVTMRELQSGNSDLKASQNRKLSEVISSYTYFRDDDVLLAKITPCFENGKLGIASGLTNGIGFGSSEFIVYRPNKNLMPSFLYYFLNRSSFREKGKKLMTGAVGHKRIPKSFFEKVLIPIPSLLEQKEIVETLDNLNNQFQSIITMYKKELINLEELKKSILEKAFKGELTNAA